MYYEGLNSNDGLRVREEDAFGYAMECILNDDDEYEEFIKAFDKDYIARFLVSREKFKLFATVFTDWFFSGDWLLRKGDADD